MSKLTPEEEHYFFGPGDGDQDGCMSFKIIAVILIVGFILILVFR